MGGLLGDVFFHTIPHLSAGHSHDPHAPHTGHSEEDMEVSILLIMGIWCFFMLEKASDTLLGSHAHHGHTHGPDKK